MINKLKEGFFYTSLAQLANIVSLLFINIILSHNLTPRDFGVVTLVQVIATFINLFTSEAVPSAIIQNKKLIESDYGILFNYSVIAGVIAMLLFGCLGFALADMWKDDIYISVSWIMSILILASFVNCVPQGLFLKSLNFKALSIRRMISSLLGLISGFLTILLGMGIYAIVITLVVPVVFTLIFNLLYVNISYSFSLSKYPVIIVSRYVIEQTKFSLLNYGYRNIDNILIGKFLGSAALGYYSKSYQLLSQPITLFLGIISPVLQPILSNYEDDFQYLRNFYVKISQNVAFLSIPISVFFAVNSKEIIYFLFGRQWTAAIMPMTILSLSIWIQLLSQLITPIWQSLNLPKLQTRNGEISFTLIAIFICVGIISRSVVYVAIAVTISYYLNFVISAKMLMKKGLRSDFGQLAKHLVMPVLSGISCALVLILTVRVINFGNLFITLFFRGIIWILEVIIFLLLTGNLKNVYKFLKK